MRVLVVHAHPNPESFLHAILEQVERGLTDAGHDCEVIDLLARRWVRGKKVAWAEGLIFVAPVFWMGLPAILKGWMERVFAYGFAHRPTPWGWAGHLEGRVPLLTQREGHRHPDVLHRGGVRQRLARRHGHGPVRLVPEDGGSARGEPRLLLRRRRR